MKTELKAKFLQHLSQKRKDEGFTLIELLVVIIIIGILSAIALPSFLNQSAKARASEARTNVGAMNRSQQTYYLESQKFSDTVDKLGIGVKNTPNYAYEIDATAPETAAINKGKSLNKDLKSHVGGVFSVGGQTPSILCQAKAASKEADAATDVPTNTKGAIACGTNTEPVGG